MIFIRVLSHERCTDGPWKGVGGVYVWGKRLRVAYLGRIDAARSEALLFFNILFFGFGTAENEPSKIWQEFTNSANFARCSEEELAALARTARLDPVHLMTLAPAVRWR